MVHYNGTPEPVATHIQARLQRNTLLGGAKNILWRILI
jgi:hypothetical protein